MTPAGVPIVEGLIEHRSTRVEAGIERNVDALVPFVAIGEIAQVLADAPLGLQLNAAGFVAARSRKNARLVLHVTEIRFVEGN